MHRGHWLRFTVMTLMIFSCTSNDIVTGSQTIEAVIRQPQDAATIDQQTVIQFTATAQTPSGTALTAEQLVWRSDTDGIIGYGSSFRRSGLRVGGHIITLTATDESGESGAATLRLNITENTNRLAVHLISPAADTQTSSASLVALRGAATLEGDSLTDPLQLEWRSDIDGVLGNGPAIDPGGLTPGQHRLQLIATEPGGIARESRAETSLKVTAAAAGRLTTDILSPENGAMIVRGEPILFSGSAQQDSLILGGTDLEWTSSMNGLIGIGESCIVDNLDAGTHRITMTARGINDAQQAVSITLHIQ